MLRFRNAILDLDGLICDTEPLYMRAANMALQAAGADYVFTPEEYGRRLTGRSILLNAEYLRERFALNVTARDLAQAVMALFTVLVSNPENITPMPGLHALIDLLKQKEVRLAIASSSRRDQAALMLQAVNLAGGAFPTVVTGDDSIPLKPQPDIYLKALAEMGAEPSETFALEDSLSGVRAARAAGLFVIAVKNDFTRGHDLSEANLVARDLDEAKEFLIRTET